MSLKGTESVVQIPPSISSHHHLLGQLSSVPQGVLPLLSPSLIIQGTTQITFTPSKIMAPSTDSRTTAEVEQNHLAKEYLDDITNKFCTHRRQCKDSWKRFRQECKQKITYLPTTDDLRRFFDEQKELVTQAMSLYLYREQELEICLWHQRHMNSIPESELNWTVYQMRATVRDQREEYLEKFLSQLQRGLEVACKYNDTVESNPRFLPMHKRDFFMFWNTFIYEKKALLIHHEHAKTASKDETFLNEVRYECYHRILVNAADMLYSYDEAKAILYAKHRSIPIDPELARKPLKEAEDSWSALRIRLDALWALQSVQSDTQGPILDERFLGMVKEIKHLHLRIKKARKYLNKHSMEGYEYY